MNYTHELIMPNEDLPFTMFLFEGEKENFVRENHWHRSIEIFAVFQGELNFFLSGKEILLRKGEFILVNSNEVHSIQTLTQNKSIVLQLPMSTFERYYTDEHFIYFSHSKKDSDEELMHRIAEMYHVYQIHDAGYELYVLSQFYRIVYLLVQKYREENVNPEQLSIYKKLNRLSKITDYIKQNYDQDLSLESLAEKFGYSPTYLSRMFRKYAQINYKTYVDNVRLEHAFLDLQNPNLGIGEIALKHGFPNSKAFAKVFCHRYGMMPNEYRKQKKDKKVP